MMKRIFDCGTKLDSECVFRQTPLALAVAGGRVKAAEWLLEHGASPNDELALVAAEKGYVEMLNWLLAHGVCLNGRNAAGRTALHEVTGNGAIAVMAWLIAQGADINACDNAGRRPLDMA